MTVQTFGGLELLFSYVPHNTLYLDVVTDVLAIPPYHQNSSDYEAVTIRIATSSSNAIISTVLGSTVVDTETTSLDESTLPTLNVRLFLNDNHLSVTINGKWVYSYAFAYVSYPILPTTITASIHVHATGGQTTTLSNIIRREFTESRDAVYIDYESNGQDAIGSVIQERPIQVLPQSDRSFGFTYALIKGSVPAHHVYFYQDTEQNNGELSSDGLVYFYNIGISQNVDTARAVGFVTKLYRLSNLNTAGIQAAYILQQKALQSRHQIGLQMRLDPRVEITDHMPISITASGTQRSITDDVIVESASIAIADGQYTMQISGRRNE
jgi:hypothetical protein